MIAQSNARIAGDVLTSCQFVIKSLPFNAQLHLLQFLHGYDKGYRHACDQLQTAHDEGRFLSVRLLKLIYPTFKTQEQVKAALAEIPEMSERGLENKLLMLNLPMNRTDQPQPLAPSLRLYQRGDGGSKVKSNKPNNSGKKRRNM